jgi:AraC-like DNA-binding protein
MYCKKPQMQEKHGERKAVLHPVEAARHYSLKQYFPSQELAPYVEHFWIVRWNLQPGDTYLAELLPNPSVNMSFTVDSALINGIITKKFTYRLSGAGTALGVRFLAGGFYPFLGASLATITNATIPVSSVFTTDPSYWRDTVLTLKSNSDIITHAERLLLSKQPQSDEHIAKINIIVARICDDRSIKQVRTVADLFSMSERTLQHSFRKYVGVGLKWIINRFRLQEAAAVINLGQHEWATIASELGYTDQSHFIHDFKNILGKTPADYQAFHATPVLATEPQGNCV